MSARLKAYAFTLVLATAVLLTLLLRQVRHVQQLRRDVLAQMHSERTVGFTQYPRDWVHPFSREHAVAALHVAREEFAAGNYMRASEALRFASLLDPDAANGVAAALRDDALRLLESESPTRTQGTAEESWKQHSRTGRLHRFLRSVEDGDVSQGTGQGR